MHATRRTILALGAALAGPVLMALCAGPPPPPGDLASQAPNTWVKRSPLPGGPVSPRMGYESTLGYDPRARLLIRWGGHNQGGGGEQNAETWTFDPVSARWTLKETNDTAPGVCCGQQNVFDLARNRFVRFPSFSGSHGWQWTREVALKNSSVWTYDLATNTWRDMRPMPEPRVGPLRCAAWDSDHEVIVVFGGEGNSEGTLAYDPCTNTWTHLRPPVQPAFRSGGNMAYDAGHKLHILFGAQFINDPHTWAYDLKANRWTDLKTTGLPPTDRNDAVLTYDALNRVVLAVVKVTEGKGSTAKVRLETWALDVGKRTWTRCNPPREPAPSGNRARLLTFLPDHGVAVLENRTHQPLSPNEQQIWTYRYAHPGTERNPPPAAVAAPSLRTHADRAVLSWKASSSKSVTRYVVLRGEGELPWKATLQRLAEVARGQTSYEDRDVKPGRVYHYAVQAVDAAGRSGPLSQRARTQPRVVEGVVASVLSERQVELTWNAPAEDDVAGYHVERAVVEVYSGDQLKLDRKQTAPLKSPSVAGLRRFGAFETLTRAVVKETRWTDTVDLSRPVPVEGKPIWDRPRHKDAVEPAGKPYERAVFAYRVRAVNRLGVKGGPSPWVLTIPSAPQFLYSREKGTRCDLKWAGNPERGLKGYRVYRLDGRYSSQPVSRLTPEPVAATTWTDDKAGKVARRYHVVAVDALGQEGVPSAPVWFEREWKSFYRPFVLEWHQ
jgi:hypothetical protein